MNAAAAQRPLFDERLCPTCGRDLSRFRENGLLHVGRLLELAPEERVQVARCWVGVCGKGAR